MAPKVVKWKHKNYKGREYRETKTPKQLRLVLIPHDRYPSQAHTHCFKSAAEAKAAGWVKVDEKKN